MQEVHTPLPIGTAIRGHYIVESLLSQGGSEVVYLVKDQRVKDAQHNQFVLKEVIDPHKQERYRFIFEGVALKQVRHQALPRVYQVFNDDRHDRVYLLMEYIEGPNLETLRQQQPEQRFSWLEAMSIMAPIIDAVGYLHRQEPPIIHRDIKLTNIIVPKAEARAVLVDFGIVKKYDLDSATVSPCSPNYRAPELYSRGSDIRTDMYELGATFYMLLTGMVPADGLSRMRQLDNEGTDPLKPVNEVVPTVPVRVARAIYRAMSIHADNRFSSVERFWDALWETVNASAVEQLSELSSDMPPASSRPPVISTGERAVEQAAATSLQKRSGVGRVSFSRKLDVLILLVLAQQFWDALWTRRRQPASIARSTLPTSSPLPEVPKQVLARPATVSIPKQLVAPEEEQVDTSPTEPPLPAASTSSGSSVVPEGRQAQASSTKPSLRAVDNAQSATPRPSAVLEEEPADALPWEQSSPRSGSAPPAPSPVVHPSLVPTDAPSPGTVPPASGSALLSSSDLPMLAEQEQAAQSLPPVASEQGGARPAIVSVPQGPPAVAAPVPERVGGQATDKPPVVPVPAGVEEREEPDATIRLPKSPVGAMPQSVEEREDPDATIRLPKPPVVPAGVKEQEVLDGVHLLPKPSGGVRPPSSVRKLGLLFILLAFLISLGFGASFLSRAVSRPAAHSAPPAPTVLRHAPTSASTSTTVLSSYPTLAGTYNGTIYNLSLDVSTSISLTGVRQSGGIISGYLTVGPKLRGSGPFGGTIDKAHRLQFTVTDAAGHARLFFEGVLQSATSLSGDYYACSSAGPAPGNQCSRDPGGYGIWSVALAPSGQPSSTSENV